MSVASRAKGLRSGLFCARCDNEVPECAAECASKGLSAGNTGRAARTCGSRAFYRAGARPWRSIMPKPSWESENADAVPEAPGRPARRTFRGARRAMDRA